MNGAINFTYGFSHGVEWGWPIAVYLLLAGISGGAIIVALMIRYYKKQTEETPLLKAASLVSFSTIALGMVFLVGDLEKPLYFWKILINYNFTSVMSIGVLALCIYIPLTFVMCVYVFEKEIFSFIPESFMVLAQTIMSILKTFRPFIQILCVVFAVVVCAYTGFLISVLVRFPILNTAILPALFVVSGLSAGTAASSLVAAKWFHEDTHSADMKILHTLEWPIMAVEMLFLFMLYISLVVGNAAQQSTTMAFTGGAYSSLLWMGVVGIGFGIPLIVNFALGKKVASSCGAFYVSSIASVVGVLFLRMFIIYAGQTFSV